ncbi:SRPBCC family protein [Devosia sp. A16]|uniref:SRPBCC family protein n=1 Tax=Devosia sp. A16 TaxID=1736675 RepID=UPI0009EC035F|nr:SRPBCC family protein [Devosia sp. A16]
MSTDQTSDSAPLRARKDDKADGFTYVGRSVTINRPRHELFAFWRDFQNLSTFMENIEAIEFTGPDRAVWTVRAPAGTEVQFETEIVDIVDDTSITWRSTPDSPIKTEGRVTFADAPGNRGTIVTADIGYTPPAGDLGRVVAKLFMAEPNIQARHELKRFKMLMEAGEIATPINHRN